MKTYFGFGIAPGMFPEECAITRRPLQVGEVKTILEAGVVSCLNPSHTETIRVLTERFGLSVEVPVRAPIVNLQPGDRLEVLGVSGLPRLEGRHEYAAEEIERAKFAFSIWTVSES